MNMSRNVIYGKYINNFGVDMFYVVNIEQVYRGLKFESWFQYQVDLWVKSCGKY